MSSCCLQQAWGSALNTRPHYRGRHICNNCRSSDHTIILIRGIIRAAMSPTVPWHQFRRCSGQKSPETQ
ncbi:hypothetical protein C4K38_4659 [Pseudomonas chlororaphis subsp. piscium]|nr:hypothetical protein C4K38_4659 [Pseudomonas chlororaphis subsp. piscium]